ncbi:CARDB domain-containing protein [Falsiroseomonas oryzae]|uniref:CARDB domain-containing protein n=1 Tax=Falsiroseomonas oryzae TaxID=2766473 RepID=UPI0022EB95FF|nr:CARDB domain-containing protein [Roseomonas sp. MO-31]
MSPRGFDGNVGNRAERRRWRWGRPARTAPRTRRAAPANRSRLLLEALEPRVLLSADLDLLATTAITSSLGAPDTADELKVEVDLRATNQVRWLDPAIAPPPSIGDAEVELLSFGEEVEAGEPPASTMWSFMSAPPEEETAWTASFEVVPFDAASAVDLDPLAAALPGGGGELIETDGVTADPDGAWFSFTATAGDYVSALVVGEGLGIQLLDTAEQMLGLEMPNPGAGHARLGDFLVPADATYLLRVLGAPDVAFTLTLTRGAGIEAERAGSGGQREPVSPTGRVLAGLSEAGGGGMRIAVLSGVASGSSTGGGPAMVAQLNDSTVFDFDAVEVSGAQIDTVEELVAGDWDALVLGDYWNEGGLANGYAGFAAAVRSWVENHGGGLLATGYTVYAAGQSTGTIAYDLDAVIPVDTTAYYSATSGTLSLSGVSHPVTDGLASFDLGTASEYSSNSVVDVDAQVLATVNGVPAIVVKTIGSANTAYLGPIYGESDVYASSILRSGQLDRLFEQAVAWVAGGGSDELDRFSVVAQQDDELSFVTDLLPEGTLGDLEVRILDPEGTTITVGAGSATATAALAGLYTVEVAGTGTGRYVLQASGATGTVAAPAALPEFDDGDRVDAFPAVYRVSFTAPILFSSIAADDLTVNGVAATDFRVLDDRTVEFDLPAIELDGPDFLVAFATGAAQSLDGRDFTGFEAAFSVREVALEPLNPLGSLAYAGATDAVIEEFGVDQFYLTAEAGQPLTVRATPSDGSLRLQLEVLDGLGNVLANVGSLTPGFPIELRDLDVSGPIALRITSLEGAGGYSLGVLLNATREAPVAFGDPIDLDGLPWMALPGEAARIAVLGDAEPFSHDTYSLFLSEGQEATFVLADPDGSDGFVVLGLELRDEADELLTTGVGGLTNADQAIYRFVAPTDGVYRVRVLAFGEPSPYSLVVTRNAAFGLERADSDAAMPIDGVVLGGINAPDESFEDAAGIAPQSITLDDAQDTYLIRVNDGDVLTLSTTTPGDGPDTPQNAFDPVIFLYDGSGAFVGSSNNDAPDGRNAFLVHEVPPGGGGTYMVRVQSAWTGARGAYVLQVEGATGVAAPASATPELPDGAVVAAYPLTYRVTFSDPILLSSLSADDLTLNGIPAVFLNIVSSTVAEFVLPALALDGPDFVAEFADGAVRTVDGRDVQGFTAGFSLPEFALEPVNPLGSLAYLGQVEATLAESGAEQFYLTLDPDQRLSLRLAPLDPGLRVRLEVIDSSSAVLAFVEAGAAGQAVDLLDLDVAGPLRLRVIGVEGAGEYRFSVTLNAAVETPVAPGEAIDLESLPWTPLLGSGESITVLGDAEAGSQDSYGLWLAAGEAISVVVANRDTEEPSGLLSLELRGEDGTLHALGSAGFLNADHAIHRFVTPADGAYRVTVSGAGAAAYSLVVTRRAAFDLERPEGEPTVVKDVVLGGLGGRGGGATSGGGTGTISTSNDIVLFDVDGFEWDIEGDGSINDGTNDAYDGGQYLIVTQGASEYWFEWFNSAGTEMGGRQIVFGPDTSSGLSVTRKVYVPNTGNQGFARFLESFTNTSSETRTFTVRIETNLGSDSGTIGIATSSGDATYAAGDRWVVTDDSSDGSGDPTMLHVVAGDGNVQLPFQASRESSDDLYTRYSLTLAPGETRRILHFAVQNTNRAAAQAVAPRIAALDTELDLLAGLTEIERNQIVNFDLGDSQDRYTVFALEGDVLTIGTSTPGDGPAAPENFLDPVLDLYNPSGELVASSDNDAGDGRNGLLSYEVPVGASGAFEVRVRAGAGGGKGAYVLQVSGARDPFVAPAATPPIAAGGSVASFPDIYRVTFDADVLFSSVSADDLSVDGIVATGFTVIDARTIDFAIDNAERIGGLQEYVALLADGAIRSIDGRDFTGFVAGFSVVPFVLEGVAPAGSFVHHASIEATLEAGQADQFNIALDPDQLLALEFVPDDPAIRARLDVVGTEGQVLASVEATVPGETLRLQGLTLSGPLSFLVTGLEGSGSYRLSLAVNASFEPPAGSGEAAVDLDALAWTGLPQGADRIGLLGNAIAGTPDLFSLTLEAGQAATFALARTESDAEEGALTLELVDPAGTLLAIGTGDAFNAEQSIYRFVAPAAGTYRIRVSASEPASYALVVTRGAEFDLELGARRPLAITGVVTGNLGELVGTGDPGTGTPTSLGITLNDVDGFRWDIEGDGSIGDGSSDAYDGGLYLITDGTWFNWSGSGTADMAGRQVTTSSTSFGSISATRKVYVPEGGPAGFARHLESFTNTGTTERTVTVQVYTNIGSGSSDTIIVGSDSGDTAYGADDRWVVVHNTAGSSSSRPRVTHVVAGDGAQVVPSSAFQQSGQEFYTTYTLTLAPGETQRILHFSAQASSNAAALALAPRLAELDPELLPLIGLTRQELDEIVNFDVGDFEDRYLVQAVAGDNLVITTTTPGDGPDQPPNSLDPRIELYNPSGVLVASSDNDGPDGRNVLLNYVVPAGTSGAYEIRVLPATRTAGGDYILNVSGATGVWAPPTVVEVDPTYGRTLNVPPTTITLVLSDAVRADSVQASDLVLTSGTTTGVTLIDGRTLVFDVTIPAVDGLVNWSLPAGAVSDLQGQGNIVSSGGFFLDLTAPEVTAHSPDPEANAPLTSITFTFSETIAAGTVSLADVASFTGPGGQNLSGALSSVNVTGNTVTVNFSSRVAAGTYTLVLGPNITDLSGNAMAEAYTATVLLRSPDLSPTEIVRTAAPADAIFGTTIEVSWTVQNIGDAPLPENWYDRIWLSSDATLNTGADRDLGYHLIDVAPLAGGGSYTRTASVTLPLEAAYLAGSYHLLIQSDAFGWRQEANESNNVRASEAFTITVPPVPDLVVDSVIPAQQATAGQPMSVTWTVRNAGTAAATGPWRDYVYLSTSPTNLTSLTHLGTFTNNVVLEAGATLTQTQSVTIPQGFEGERWVVVLTDAWGEINEHVGENNNRNVSLDSVALNIPPLPDLVVGQVTDVPAEGLFGQPITVSWTVRNDGTADATGSWNDAVYISPTADFNNLTYVGQLSFDGTIAAGETIERTHTVTLPQGVTGARYVVVHADYTNQIYEYNRENNNRTASTEQVTIGVPALPDLIVTEVEAPPEALSGEAVPITWTIRNDGTAATTGGWTDRLYLATGPDSGLTSIADFAYEGTLAAGETVTRTQSITLPQTLSGSRWIVVRTDIGNAVYEYDRESNNDRSSATPIDVTLQPFPNLVVAEVTPPTAAFSGQESVVSWTVTNTGNGATSAPTWYDYVYLSLDTTLDVSDPLLGFASNPSYLAVGGSYANSLTFTLPQGISGTYHLIVVADGSHYVFEYGNEGDNTRSASVPVQLTPPPDLEVTSVTPPPQGFSGQPLNLTWTVANTGAGGTRATAWWDRVMLSADETLGAGDVEIGRFRRNGQLGGGDSYTGSGTVQLPIGVAGENFRIFVVADSSNEVYEHTDENNNAGSSGAFNIILTPPPDLETEILEAPSSALAGQTVGFAYLVTNFGATATPNSHWTDRVYLSVDDQIDAGDTQLAAVTRYGALAVDGFYERELNLRLPDGISGTYRLIVRSDTGSEVFELDRSNNIAVSEPLTIGNLPANLQVALAAAPDQATAGRQVRVDWTVTNAGTGPTSSGAWVDQIVLSTSGALGTSDNVVLATVARTGALAAGASYSQTALVTVPLWAAGDVKLFVVTDAQGQVFESSNSDNAFAPLPLRVTAQTADLRVTSAAGPTVATAGDRVTVNWTVANEGIDATAASYWYDEIYLSTDANLGSTDRLLGRVRRTNPLAGGAAYDAALAFDLPADIATGTYRLLVVTDSDGNVLESQENDNVRAVDTGTIDITAIVVSRPDLEVSGVSVPADGISGQPLAVTWTVTNAGTAVAPSRYDAVYLSRDQVLDRNNDIYLGAHFTGALGIGATQTVTEAFRLPAGLSGPFWAFVLADGGGYTDDAERSDNQGRSGVVQLVLPPPVDLTVGTISIPANVLLGTTASITYTVQNLSSNALSGFWTDAVYLSEDDVWDVDDLLIGRVDRTTLAANGSYTETLVAPLPGVAAGDYRVIVRSDIFNFVPEASETNNIGASIDSTHVDVPALVLGTPSVGALAARQSAFYKLEVAAGETIRLAFDSAAGAGSTELYVRYGEMPTRGVFDRSANVAYLPDQELLIPETQAGTYYVLVYGDDLPGAASYSLLAESIPFSVRSVVPGQVGDDGSATIEIAGARFDANTVFQLVAGDGSVRTATNVLLRDSATAFARFNLQGAPLGSHTVRAISASGPAELADAIEVVPEDDAPDVDMTITGPTQMRPDRLDVFNINYSNAGLSDLGVPLFVITSLTGTRMGTAVDNITTGPIQLLGAPLDGPADILRPDADYSVPMLLSTGSATGPLDIRVSRILATDQRAIVDWSSIEHAVRPAGLSDDAWGRFWSRFQPAIGPTWGDYVGVLTEMMVRLSEPGNPIRDVRALFAAQIAADADFRPASAATGRLVDSDSGAGVADVQVSAYRVQADGTLVLGGVAVSDSTGAFSFARLTPGDYQLALSSRTLDADGNGEADLLPFVFTVPADQDTAIGNVGVLPETVAVARESDAALATDSSGVTHIVWVRETKIWHARLVDGAWVDAAPIADAVGSSVKLVFSDKLIDGTTPGLVAVWLAGEGNGSEVMIAVARLNGTGPVSWSAPVAVTGDATRDRAPDVVVDETGAVVLAFLKDDNDIQDDTDVYFARLVLNSDALGFAEQVEQLARDLEVEPQNTVSAGLKFEKKVEVLGLEMAIAVDLGGSGGVSGCNFEVSVSGAASVQVGESGRTSAFDAPLAATLSGQGTAKASWTADPAIKDWAFKRASASWGMQGSFDWKNGLLILLEKAGPQGFAASTILQKAIGFINRRTPLTIENGVNFTAGFEFTDMQWTGQAPFPSFLLPESVAEASVSVQAGPYLNVKQEGVDDVELKISGFIKAAADIIPSFSLTNLTVNLQISGRWKKFTFERTISGGYEGSALDMLDAGDGEGITMSYDPGAAIGTGNVYGSNAIIADVANDLYQDGAPALATGLDGSVFAAWNKETSGFADQVVVADYDGASWTVPTVLPGSDGLNAGVRAIVDGAGHRLVVWARSDASALSSSITMDELNAIRDDNDLFFAVHDGTGWSAANLLAATAGRDTDLTLGCDANGNVVVLWTERDENDVFTLRDAVWTGSSWSAARIVATGDGLAAPALGRNGDSLIAFWTEDTDPAENRQQTALFYSTLGDGGWSAATLFAPTLLEGLAAAVTSGEDGSDSAVWPSAAWPPVPVPEECLKCKPEEIKKITEAAPVCRDGGGSETTFDPERCIEKTIVYEPCVVRPRDPNDIIGPSGFGEEGWIRAADTFEYRIRFENAADASAPAQNIVITQQLDPDLDFRTFRVDDFGFGDVRIQLPADRPFHNERIDLRETRGYFVDVAFSIDVTTGIATWSFQTIDPDTGEAPSDASVGLLPPNDETGRGDGFVSYTVRARRNEPTGTVVDAVARIIFDTEEPIDTPPIFNTLDASAPASQVLSLPAETELTEFEVSWAGADDDGGSAIADYTIIYTEDGGPETIWLLNTTLTSAIFVGEVGRTYTFYSIARDNAGNSEQAPATPDATILVAGNEVGVIEGTVFEDADGSGVINNAEAGIAGRIVFLDTDSDGERDAGETFVETGADGSFSFVDLEPGSYRVLVEGIAGWIATGETPRLVTVEAYETAQAGGLGVFELAAISGVKFNDLDADGVRDAGENGIEGVTLFVDRDGDNDLDEGEVSTVTLADGSFAFTGLAAGTVRIGEVARTGWARTTPPVSIKVTSGLDLADVSIGNVRTASISGMKFEDVNGNGLRETGENGVEGWTIFIDANGDGLLQDSEASTLTAADGTYRFTGLLPGSYVIAEVQRAGWVQTTPTGSAAGAGIEVSLAGSDVALTMEGCGCGVSWSDPGTAPSGQAVNLAALSTAQSRDLTGLTAALQDARFEGLSGAGVRTVLIDTGIDLNHAFWGPDSDGNGVADRIVHQWDFADNDNNASDIAKGHGSHVASMIASQDALYGGVAPGTELIVLKVFGDNGRGTFGAVERALQWVIANAETWNIGVVNMSLGDNGNWTNTLPRYGLGDEFAKLAAKDIITVAAAGNFYNQYNGMGVAYPAADPAVLAVGAVWAGDFGGPWTVSTGATDYSTGADRIAAFSQRDANLLDVMAPGARFNGANATGGVQTMQGTSQAAGFVSGAAALAQQLAQQVLGRKLSTAEFAALLERTGDMIVDGDDENDNVRNTGLSFPRIQFTRLFEEILNITEAPPAGGTGSGSGTGGSTGGGTRPAQQAAAFGVHNVTLVAGEDASDVSFGNFKLATFTGTVFLDRDRDGEQDPDEVGVAGGKVRLDPDSGNALVVTDATGAFTFESVGPGLHVLELESPPGYSQTTPGRVNLAATSGAVQTLAFGVWTNRDPVAGADSATLNAATGGNLDVADLLSNDSDPDGDDVALVSVAAQTALGAAVSLQGEAVVVDPAGVAALRALAAGQTLSDSFTYVIADEYGFTATGTVTLTFTGTNEDPSADPDVAATDEDTTVTIDVVGNDSDSDAGTTLKVATLPALSALGAALSLGPDGRVLYDPRGAAVLQALAPGQSVVDSFSYTVSDEDGGTATATVTVTVDGRNDLPVARPNGSSTDEDTAVVIRVLLNDSDVDVGQQLSLATLPSASSDRGAALTVLADGRIGYDPRGSAFLQSLAFGQTVVDTFAYRVSDGAGGEAQAIVSVVVSGLADPVLQLTASTTEDDLLQITVPGVTVTAAPGVSSQLVPVAISGGAILYDPRSANRAEDLALGESLADIVSFTGTNAVGETVTGTVAITVTGRNDAPRAQRMAMATAADTPLDVDALAGAWDHDHGATLGLLLPAVQSALGASLTIVEAQIVDGRAVGGRIVYDPRSSAALAALLAGESLSDSFTFAVQDEHGAQTTATVSILVAGTASDSAVTLTPRSIGEDQLLRFRLDSGWTLLDVNGLSQFGAAGSVVNGAVNYDPRRAPALQALALGEALVDTLAVTMRDGLGNERKGLVAVTVTGANDAPVARDDIFGTREDFVSLLEVTRNDSDPDAGAQLFVSVPPVSARGAALVVLGNRVQYDPTAVDAFRALNVGATLDDSFTYTLLDEHGAASTATVSLTVLGRNTAPTAAADSAATDEDTAIDIDVRGNDRDPDSSIAVVGVVARSTLGATLTLLGDGSVRYDPTGARALQSLAAGQVVEDSFVYEITDDQGARVRGTATVTVTGRNDAPVARRDAAATLSRTPIDIAVLANDSDVDAGAMLTIETVGASRFGASIGINPDGTLRYDPTASAILNGLPPGAVRVDRFTYTVTDGSGGTSTATVVVTITGQGTAPAVAATTLLQTSDARPTRRMAAEAVPEEEFVLDLAAPFASFETAKADTGQSSWQVGFVAEGPAPVDPNERLVIDLERGVA